MAANRHWIKIENVGAGICWGADVVRKVKNRKFFLCLLTTTP
jgi:hypothetical protein